MKIITIGFFRATGCSRVCQRYSHVEMRFSDGTVTSITRDPGYVHYDQTRVLSNQNYSCFMSLHVTSEQEERMQNAAYNHHVRKTPFGWFSMYWNFLCCPIRGSNSLFCSQYVVELLQMCGQCMDLDPATTSPTHLYIALLENEDFYFSTNIRRSRQNLMIDV